MIAARRTAYTHTKHIHTSCSDLIFILDVYDAAAGNYFRLSNSIQLVSVLQTKLETIKVRERGRTQRLQLLTMFQWNFDHFFIRKNFSNKITITIELTKNFSIHSVEEPLTLTLCFLTHWDSDSASHFEITIGQVCWPSTVESSRSFFIATINSIGWDGETGRERERKTSLKRTTDKLSSLWWDNSGIKTRREKNTFNNGNDILLTVSSSWETLALSIGKKTKRFAFKYLFHKLLFDILLNLHVKEWKIM